MERARKNGGETVESLGNGTKLKTSYGKDDSDVAGSASKERIGKFGGGMEDLSHSLTGTSANQKGA